MGDAYQIQLRRATAAENAAFTGAAGELVFEEDNNLVYIHDGSTPGGHLLPRTAAQMLSLLSGQALAVGTIDTGQGAVECYPMNQGMRTTDSVTHNDLALTGALNVRGSGGSATNRLKATYNGGSGIAVFGPDSSGGSTQLQIGTSNAGSFTAALTIGSTQIVTFAAPIHIKSYTVATLPSAASAAGLIYVSNEAGGAVPAFSDGINWRRVTDRAVVS